MQQPAGAVSNIAEQWHTTRNEDVTPDEVAPSQCAKVAAAHSDNFFPAAMSGEAAQIIASGAVLVVLCVQCKSNRLPQCFACLACLACGRADSGLLRWRTMPLCGLTVILKQEPYVAFWHIVKLTMTLPQV